MFAPFTLRATAPLPAEWIAWLGETLRGDQPMLRPFPAGFADLEPRLDTHGVLPLLYRRLRDSPAWTDTPAATRQALQAAFQTAATRTLLQEDVLMALAERLAAAKVRVLLLKGAAAGRTVYASPAERPISDFDLLVPRDQMERARAALVGLGFREPGLQQRGWLGEQLRHYRAEIPLIGVGPRYGNLLVELHWTLLELPYYMDRIDMAQVWNKAEASALPGARLPGRAAMLVHAAAHLALHHSRDLRLIWLVDVDRLAHDPTLDWEEVVWLAERWNLGLALQASLGASAGWLHTPVPVHVTVRLQPLARDRAGRAMWGLGDERPGRALRRAAVTLAALSPRSRLGYAGWLALRAALGTCESLHIGGNRDTVAR